MPTLGSESSISAHPPSLFTETIDAFDAQSLSVVSHQFYQSSLLERQLCLDKLTVDAET